METTEYINSGILELYVIGTLSETETTEVAAMSEKHPEIKAEILSIEKAIVSLSFSMAPYLSVANYNKLKTKLFGEETKVVQLAPRQSNSKFIGWAAAAVLLVGTGYFYNQNQISQDSVLAIAAEKSKIDSDLKTLQLKKQQSDAVLAVVRDEANTVVPLAGQAVSPTSKAKIYWNKTTEIVYVDASGLPEPPAGMEYQIWSLQLSPALVPTSLGTLVAFAESDSKIFAVANTNGAQGFGITLEPKGGSPTPTMEQLYTLGKV